MIVLRTWWAVPAGQASVQPAIELACWLVGDHLAARVFTGSRRIGLPCDMDEIANCGVGVGNDTDDSQWLEP
ncbi:hypothetical protein F4782DRAFT_516342 [Xylaria castorea]|nr:hypothetical protein F4782DRAFT_516342 [Xylaria castorea]